MYSKDDMDLVSRSRRIVKSVPGNDYLYIMDNLVNKPSVFIILHYIVSIGKLVIVWTIMAVLAVLAIVLLTGLIMLMLSALIKLF